MSHNRIDADAQHKHTSCRYSNYCDSNRN